MISPLAALAAAALAAAAPSARDLATAEAEQREPSGGDPRAVRALLADLELLVEVQGAGWQVDEDELRDLLPAALMSACRVTPSVLRAARDDLARREATLGGPAEEAFVKNGRSLDGLDELLLVERTRRLLDRALLRLGECPFYVAPDPAFRSRQTEQDGWALHFESGGTLLGRVATGRFHYGFGGFTRGLVGRGFSRASLLAGLEFGGGALIQAGGTRVTVNYLPAIPLLLRLHQRSWHYDLEVAPVALVEQDDTRVSFGARIALGGGIQARRIRGIVPWAGAGISYQFFPEGPRPAIHLFRAGVRVGLFWR